jgi:hypothetical protein
VRQVRLKAAPAARFVHAGGTDDNQILRSDEPLGVHGGISTLHADGEQLDDFFGNRKEARHWLEGAPEIIGVEAGDDHPLARVGHAHANVDEPLPEELAFINPYNFGPRLDFFEDLARVPDDLGRQLKSGMRNDFRLSVSLVNDRFEDLHALPGDFGALQTPDQFFTFP